MASSIQQTKIALLCGGISHEREISLVSGKETKAALESIGYDVDVFDPADRASLARLIEEDFTLAFLCLHGRGGEDGTIQGFLETIGLHYTGSGVQASALAFDKTKTKQIYQQANIPTPPGLNLNKNLPYNLAEIMQLSTEKYIVKPATEGSSLGISIAEKSHELQDAIERAFDYDKNVVVERFIEGIEVTASVLGNVGNNELTALPLVQMIPHNEFYDFASKYTKGGAEHLCPAPLSDELTYKIQQLACAAHRALGCRDVSRTDFIVDTQNQVWALETNTIPGMTPTSLLPEAAQAAGMSFVELCESLINLALW